MSEKYQSEKYEGTKEAWEALQDFVDDALLENSIDWDKATFIFQSGRNLTIEFQHINEQEYDWLKEACEKGKASKDGE